jgi:hypothetical protein
LYDNEIVTGPTVKRISYVRVVSPEPLFSVVETITTSGSLFTIRETVPREGRTTVRNPCNHDAILLHIEEASVIRFFWDPATKEFKKDWVSD